MAKLSRTSVALIILAATGAAAAVVWSRHTLREEREDALYIPPAVSISAEAELLRDYLRINTSNPPGNERPGAEFLAAYLRKSGVEAEIIESAPGRANVYARIRGKRSGDGLLLYNHIDVAPAPPEGWTAPPFAAEVRNAMIYGRGALDMKGIAIAQLLAFIDVAKSGRQPARDLVFLATADEEAGGKLGVAWLQEHRPDVFKGIGYALNEGGVTEMSKEQIAYFGIEVGSRQFIVMELTSPRREDLQSLRLDLEPYFAPLDPMQIAPEVAAYMRAVEPRRAEGKEILRDVGASIAQGKFWNLNPEFKALTHNTMYMNGITEAANGQWRSTLTLHNLPGENPEERIAFIRSFADRRGVALKVDVRMGPTTMSPLTTPFYEELASSVRKVHGNVDIGPIVLAYGTNDSRYLRAAGIQTYGIYPFKVDLFQTQGVHGTDERIRVDWYMDGVRLMRQIVRGWCGAEAE